MRKHSPEQPQEAQYGFPHVTDPSLDPGTGILTTYIEGQDAPIQINGPVDTIAELAEAAYKADMAREAKQTRSVASKAVEASVEPVRASETPTTHYTPPSLRQKVTQYFKDAHVREFDKAYGTSLYDELLDKRRREAIFLKAAELSLFDKESDYYKTQLKRMSKRVDG